MEFVNRLKIRNFGPIVNGYDKDDGYIPFGHLCVFCGTQGSGKSTVVKLYSTFIWLEKALLRGDIKPDYVIQFNRFKSKFLAHLGIDGYLKEDTFLHFKGLCYDFIYKNGRLEISDHDNVFRYERPQIMYFPAERNLLSVIEKSSAMKGLPDMLLDMQEEYRKACLSLGGDVRMPVNDVSFHYDSLNRIGSIVAPGYKVRLSNASSGLQSVSPLYITLKYLSEKTRLGKANQDVSKSTQEEQERIDRRINEILLDDSIDDATRSALIKKLSDNVNKRLVSIIEEPEQNLFPDSQENVLHEIIRLSTHDENQLLITTHSPYMLNSLMIAIKAHQVEEDIRETATDEDMTALGDIVPEDARIEGSRVSVFQTSLDGSISMLNTIDDIPSDDNELNGFLMEANSKYSQLIEIQSRYE